MTSRIAFSIVLCLLSGCASMGEAPLAPPEQLLPAAPEAQMTAPAHPRIPAAQVDTQVKLSEMDLARMTLALNPDLQAQRARLGVAKAQLTALGIVPDPQVSMSRDRPSGIGLVDALGAGLNLDIASLLTLPQRRRGASSAAEQVSYEVAWSEWLTVNQVRTLARRQAALERQVALSNEAAAAAHGVLQLADASLAQGDVRIDDVSLYRAGYLDAKDRAMSLERALAAARIELLTLVGLAPDSVLRLAQPSWAPHDVANLRPQELAARAFQARLDLDALREGYAAQEASVQVANLTALPLPQLSLSRARDTGGIWSHGIGLGFSLPLWNRNRGEIVVALATREQLAAEYRARLHQTRADIAALWTELQGLDAARRELQAQLPSLQRTRDTLALASREGSVPVVTYEAIRATLLDKELALLGIEQAIAEGEVALEAATGDFIWEQQ